MPHLSAASPESDATEPAAAMPACPACGENHALRDCKAAADESFLRSEVVLADMAFNEAFEKWIESRLIPEDGAKTDVRYVAVDSERTYREYGRALGKFFAGTTLTEIHDGMLRKYQKRRAINANNLWTKRCGQNRIAKEIRMMKRLLKCAGLWTKEMEEAFKPLPFQRSVVTRVPEPVVRDRIMAVLESRDEWLWAYHWARLARRTCTSPFEMRMLRIEDLDPFRTRTLHVARYGSKADPRNRTIPLEAPDAIASAIWLLDRARRKGATKLSDCVFPYGVGSRHEVDVTKPMRRHSMKNIFNQVKRKAKVEFLRPYDFRHWGMTEMAERGRSIHEIMAFGGHINEKMQRHYIALSQQALRIAAASLEQPSPFDKKPPAPAKPEWDVEQRPKWIA